MVGVVGWVWPLGSEAWRVWSLLVVVGGAGYPVNLESSCHCQVAL